MILVTIVEKIKQKMIQMFKINLIYYMFEFQ